MAYKNLIEDENEARTARTGRNAAYLFIIVGCIFLYLNWKNHKN